MGWLALPASGNHSHRLCNNRVLMRRRESGGMVRRAADRETLVRWGCLGLNEWLGLVDRKVVELVQW